YKLNDPKANFAFLSDYKETILNMFYSFLLRIFPVALLGSSSQNSIIRGTLYAASLSLQNEIISSELVLFPGFNTTKALGISPFALSGIPMTAASKTAG